jgi:hypothetical protein
VGVTLQGSGTGGTGTLSYAWTPNIALSNTQIVMPIANPTSTQVYYLQVTDQFGCQTADSVFVTVSSSPTIVLDSNSPICPGVSLTLTSTTSTLGSLEWTSPDGVVIPQTASAITIPNNQVQSGVYTVQTTAPNGCTAEAQTLVAVSGGVAFEAKFLTGSTACAGDSIHFIETSLTNQPGVSYLWQFGDGTSSTQRDPIHIYPIAGAYQVQLQASLVGCNNLSVTKTIDVLACKLTPFPGFVSAKVQPNITSREAKLLVTLIEKGSLSLVVYDVNGLAVHTQQFRDMESLEHDLTFELPGVYFVHLQTVYGLVVLKVVVARA